MPPTILLDIDNEGLIKDDKFIQLTPKSFALLKYLWLHSERIVTKDELLEEVWSGVYVLEANLTVTIRELRKALGDDSKNPTYIQTVHRRGYRFIGELQQFEKNTPDTQHHDTVDEAEFSSTEDLPATQAKELAELHKTFFKLKHNRAYSEALEIGHQIHTLCPDDAGIAAEINTLQENILYRKRMINAQEQLLLRKDKFDLSFSQQIIRVLQSPNPHDNNAALLLSQTELYLAGTIDIDAYQQICNALFAPAAKQPRMDYAALSRNILAGDIALFLGSNIPQLYNNTYRNERHLARKLAKAIDYENFEDGLPSIAELYQLRLEYGQKSLVDNLLSVLPDDYRLFPLYSSLAQADKHLILISSAYDNLLEQAFLQTGKPFVELSSINQGNNRYYEAGHVLAKFSDDASKEAVYLQEDLSKLNLFDHYTIIYKIRGTCTADDSKQQAARTDTLTLSETSYFNVAENARNIIPNFLAANLSSRALLFIGYAPDSWAERLLVRILLEKRVGSQHPCYTLEEPDDPLQQAYWQKQNVQHYNIDFSQLDAHLQGVLA